MRWGVTRLAACFEPRRPQGTKEHEAPQGPAKPRKAGWGIAKRKRGEGDKENSLRRLQFLARS